MSKRKTISIFLLLIALTLSAFESGQVNFALVINEEATSLDRFFYPVLPGDTVSISVVSKPSESLRVQNKGGAVQVTAKANHGRYLDPARKGDYTLTVTNKKSGEMIYVTVIVMVAAKEQKGEYLNGYRIGYYPDATYKNRKKYRIPEGFIEVNEDNKDLFITPHFQLKQFLCKQASGWPKYLVLSPRLLIKLEHLLAGLNKKGIRSNTLFIMRGYRTPYYNHAIGNVKFSRHVFGDAADVYVDVDGDSSIDDLNNDGKINMADAEIIYQTVSKMDNDPEQHHLLGGMGKYNKNASHTFFIHVDTRGYKARW
ncbi:MAG: D-Ala-D-Ala carboxypeptidase family metallohydrolase [Bacteroidales bacterium]|nr:D-Ala-D-Ala carboxypeptidase family metallohydrolase [Bacteroidales bacterium]